MIKVFVATTETQGQRSNDFFWATEGELIISASECDRDRDDIDGPCGCRRAMTGIDSRKATTTFKVVEWRRITYRVIFRETGVAESSLSALANNDVTLYAASTLNRLCGYFECGIGDLLEYVPDSPESPD